MYNSKAVDILMLDFERTFILFSHQYEKGGMPFLKSLASRKTQRTLKDERRLRLKK
jgi:hypothetical protein